jgi:hypothetical protein
MMADTEYPHYELRRINDDGTCETPEILPVSQIPWEAKASRRGFLGTGIAVSSLVLALRSGSRALGAVAKTIKAIHAHQKPVLALAFSPDGSLLASGSSDKTAKLWSMPGGQLAHTLKTEKATNYSLAFSPDSKALGTGGTDNHVRIWDADNGLLQNTLTGHGGTVRCLRTAPDGDTLASGSSDKTIRLWSWAGCELIKVLSDHTGAVSAMDFSSEGRVLASGATDRTIRLWFLPEGKLYKVLRGHRSSVSDVAITPGNDQLLSRTLSKTIGVWTFPEGKILRVLSGRWAETRHLLLAPAGGTLFTSSGKAVQLWTMPQGRLQATLEGHLGEILTMAVSPDGQTLATGDRYGVVCLWDLQTRKRLAFLFDPAANRPGVDGATFERRDPVSGNVITYTLPCGSPVPPGATCVCNCVPGTYTITSVPRPKLRYRPRNTAPRYPIRYYPGPPTYVPRVRTGGTYCACNKVCTCIPVCQALRLMHVDATIRFMAEELLLVMGAREHDYLRWAADRSGPELRRRIQQVARSIDEGAKPRAGRWPSREHCVAYLGHEDDVVSIMAAQLLQLKGCPNLSVPFCSADGQVRPRVGNGPENLTYGVVPQTPPSMLERPLFLTPEVRHRVVRRLRDAVHRPWYVREPGRYL